MQFIIPTAEQNVDTNEIVAAHSEPDRNELVAVEESENGNENKQKRFL